mmetsp:Transcript_26612/g.69992  ORF Transcript_26612/g.69992 Transcript_26612/m.69992 type:complete len:99 (+) Transcript_26612:191-487(+)
MHWPGPKWTRTLGSSCCLGQSKSQNRCERDMCMYTSLIHCSGTNGKQLYYAVGEEVADHPTPALDVASVMSLRLRLQASALVDRCSRYLAQHSKHFLM